VIQDLQLTPERWENFWHYYTGQSQQKQALELLRQHILDADPTLLTEHAEWVELFHSVPEAPASVENTWDGIVAAAHHAGAKFPECVAAQWALESAWGKSTSGKNNFFGIKGHGTTCTTWEDYGHGAVTVKDEFRDFASIQECINWLVDRWYKDYRGYRGVNRAATREDCARLLKAEGYATDPVYSQKLINLMNAHA